MAENRYYNYPCVNQPFLGDLDEDGAYNKEYVRIVKNGTPEKILEFLKAEAMPIDVIPTAPLEYAVRAEGNIYTYPVSPLVPTSTGGNRIYFEYGSHDGFLNLISCNRKLRNLHVYEKGVTDVLRMGSLGVLPWDISSRFSAYDLDSAGNICRIYLFNYDALTVGFRNQKTDLVVPPFATTDTDKEVCGICASRVNLQVGPVVNLNIVNGTIDHCVVSEELARLAPSNKKAVITPAESEQGRKSETGSKSEEGKIK